MTPDDPCTACGATTCTHLARLLAGAEAPSRPTRVDAAVALRALGVRDEIHPHDVAAFLHPTEESARTFITGNAEHYGHPHSYGPLQVEGGWLEAVDLRDALARFDVAPYDPALPDNACRHHREGSCPAE